MTEASTQNDKSLPSGFEDITPRVTSTMANRYNKMEVDGEIENISFNSNEQIAVNRILRWVINGMIKSTLCKFNGSTDIH